MVVVFEQWSAAELDAERRRLVDSLAGLSDFTPASLHEECVLRQGSCRILGV